MPPTTHTGSGGRRREQFHLRREDVSENTKGLKNALEIHLRMLMRLYTQNTPPRLPTDAVMNSFRRRYRDAQAVEEHLIGYSYDLTADDTSSNRARAIHADVAYMTNPIATAIALLDTTCIAVALSINQQVGIGDFLPDLIGGVPDDPYNMVHEIAALKSFSFFIAWGAYKQYPADRRRADDILLMRTFYRNFVWSHLRELAVTVKRKGPAAIAQERQRDNAYGRRVRLGESRADWARANGFSESFGRLFADPECNSDDEPTVVGGVELFLRFEKAREYRDVSVGALAHDYIDPSRIQQAKLIKRANTIDERQRVEHPDNTASPISSRLPPNCALDWFDVNKFNSLPGPIRYHYRSAPIAWPLPEHRNNTDWKEMEMEDFREKYGNDVRRQFTFPTEAEMRRMREPPAKRDKNRHQRWGADSSDDDDENNDDNPGAGPMEQDQDSGAQPAPFPQTPFGSFNPSAPPPPPPAGATPSSTSAPGNSSGLAPPQPPAPAPSHSVSQPVAQRASFTLLPYGPVNQVDSNMPPRFSPPYRGPSLSPAPNSGRAGIVPTSVAAGKRPVRPAPSRPSNIGPPPSHAESSRQGAERVVLDPTHPLGVRRATSDDDLDEGAAKRRRTDMGAVVVPRNKPRRKTPGNT
ncbi:hypothetical protein MKEN_00037400 [Mycena kentingensis (nom. inval.)]|nr:hypothetical protein MKEN_00037400 [Mycena kentingensis (nom. inval.)]